MFEPEEFAPDDLLLAIYGGYGYLNVSVSRVMGVRMPGLSPELIDQSYFGRSLGCRPTSRARRTRTSP